MKYIFGGLIALSSCVAMGCGADSAQDEGHPGEPTSTTTEIEALPVQKAFVTEGQSTYVPILAAPGAKCRLSTPGDTGEASPIRADNDGIAHLQLQTGGVAGERESHGLDCESQDGVKFHRDFELEVTKEQVEQVVPPAGHFPRTWLDRPALVDDSSLTQAELVARGFPPRPDALRKPAAYQRWRERIAKPSRVAQTKDIELPGTFHTTFGSTSISNIWSGGVVTGSGGWEDVEAAWLVPSFTTPLADCSLRLITWASAWVGLGGFGTKSLVQAGIEMESVCTYDFYYHRWLRNSGQSAWWEVLPAASTVLGGFVVRPGDQMYFYTWVGDSQGNINPQGGFAWFFVSNDTYGMSTTKRATIPSSNPFNGNSAEWIVERPTVNGTIPFLAKYGSLTFLNAYADTATTYTQPQFAGTIGVVMRDKTTSDVLSYPRFDSNSNMELDWLNYN